MFTLFSLAMAGSFSPIRTAEILWESDGYSAILDARTGSLVGAGEADVVSASIWRPQPGTPTTRPHTGAGVVVVRDGGYEVVVHKGAMLTLSNGYRIGKHWLPSHWDLSKAQFAQSNGVALALCDGELLIAGKKRTFALLKVGSRGFQVRNDLVLFDDDPLHYVDLWTREYREILVVQIRRIRRQGGRWLGEQEGRPLVWSDTGTLLFVGEKKVAYSKLSSDGSVLATLDRDGGLALTSLPSQEVVQQDDLCRGQPWPHGPTEATVVCAESIEHVVDGVVLKLSRPPGKVRQVTRKIDHLNVVVGEPERVGQVWRVPLDGSAATVLLPAISRSGEVQGFRFGQPVRLSVTRVDGRPVERATAAAYERLRQAASDDGVELRIASAFRTNDEQAALYRCWRSGNCNNGNLAARPGFSRHQSGQALDLNTHQSEVREWLQENGESFGFYATVPSEAWHWEYHGAALPTALSVEQLPVAMREDPPSPKLPWPVELL